MKRDALNRVYLRRLTARDRKAFLDAVRRSKSVHGAWVAPPHDPESFSNYLKRLRREENDGSLICRKEDDAIVGVINMNQIVRGMFLSAYLGYYSFAPFQERGYMIEGLQMVIERAFGSLMLHRLEANIQPKNLRSIELVKGCGFRLEGLSRRYLKVAGRWRDHQRWAITVEDWVKR